MQKITPFLWLNNQAEEAAKYYTGVFKNSKITNISHYGKGAPVPEGTVMTVAFEIEGHEFIALNGGTHYQITPGISFVIYCDTQDEIDYYWDRLSAGGKNNVCGWTTDKFGVTWQVVPSDIGSIAKSPKAMQALMTMTKLDVAVLRAARDSE
jgi:predicted 3-demethylubiquinone-9 3-methyltransferase (glyoxalase superfamily)